jgi:hypothetical protein
VLVETDPLIAGLWRWLIGASEREILTLPLEVGTTVRDLGLAPGPSALIGFWLNKGTSAPAQRPSAWMREGLRPRSFSDDFEARITAAVRTAGGVPAKYMTFSGNPLASLVTDAAEGDEIAKDIRSRGRRWCVGDDVEWGPGAMQEFRAMRSGELKRSDSALKTKIDLREFESVSDFRFALSDSSDGAKYDARDLAKAITPARVDEAPSLFLASELTLLMPERSMDGLLQRVRADALPDVHR